MQSFLKEAIVKRIHEEEDWLDFCQVQTQPDTSMLIVNTLFEAYARFLRLHPFLFVCTTCRALFTPLDNSFKTIKSFHSAGCCSGLTKMLVVLSTYRLLLYVYLNQLEMELMNNKKYCIRKYQHD